MIPEVLLLFHKLRRYRSYVALALIFTLVLYSISCTFPSTSVDAYDGASMAAMQNAQLAHNSKQELETLKLKDAGLDTKSPLQELKPDETKEGLELKTKQNIPPFATEEDIELIEAAKAKARIQQLSTERDKPLSESELKPVKVEVDKKLSASSQSDEKEKEKEKEVTDNIDFDAPRPSPESKIEDTPTDYNNLPTIGKEKGASRRGKSQLPPDFSSKEHIYQKRIDNYPVENLIPFPKPLNNNKNLKIEIQSKKFEKKTPESEKIRLYRLLRIKEAFKHSWNGYKHYAWGHDELKPITNKFDDPFMGWSATIIDSLDSLILLNMTTEFNKSLEFLSKIDFTTSFRDDIPIFETTIRYLGGLISSYEMTNKNHKILLSKAVELGQNLLGSFDTPNRMPLLYYRWKSIDTKQLKHASTSGTLSEFGSLSLEFTKMSELTGDPAYYDAITRITEGLVKFQNDQKSDIPGLFPVHMDISGCDVTGTESSINGGKPYEAVSILNNGKIRKKTCYPTGLRSSTNSQTYSLGGLSDSVYEYFIKQYILMINTNDEKQLNNYKSLYENALASIKEHLLFKPLIPINENNILFTGTVRANKITNTDENGKRTTQIVPVNNREMSHLSCFAGGMFALGSKILNNPNDLKLAENFTNGCAWLYLNENTGIMAESIITDECKKGKDCIWNERDIVKSISGAEGLEDYDKKVNKKKIDKNESILSLKEDELLIDLVFEIAKKMMKEQNDGDLLIDESKSSIDVSHESKSSSKLSSKIEDDEIQIDNKANGYINPKIVSDDLKVTKYEEEEQIVNNGLSSKKKLSSGEDTDLSSVSTLKKDVPKSKFDIDPTFEEEYTDKADKKSSQLKYDQDGNEIPVQKRKFDSTKIADESSKIKSDDLKVSKYEAKKSIAKKKDGVSSKKKLSPTVDRDLSSVSTSNMDVSKDSLDDYIIDPIMKETESDETDQPQYDKNGQEIVIQTKKFDNVEISDEPSILSKIFTPISDEEGEGIENTNLENKDIDQLESKFHKRAYFDPNNEDKDLPPINKAQTGPVYPKGIPREGQPPRSAWTPLNINDDGTIGWRTGDSFNQPLWAKKHDPMYQLRPEAIESIFYMYRITGDSKWQEIGWKIFKNINKYCKVENGYAGLNDVSNLLIDYPKEWINSILLRSKNNDDLLKKNLLNYIYKDSMESFWLAETLKYFYLLFEDPEVWSLDDVVFNTEAHPFYRLNI